MANKITVQFEAKGSSALKSAIDQLHLAQVKLQKGTKAYERALNKLNATQGKTKKGMLDITTQNRLTSNSFATLRSKMLLASFAFSIVNASILKLGRMYGEQEQAEKRLEHLVGKNVDALKAKAAQLQEVTRFGDEETMAAMGMVAAYTTNEAAISQLTQAAMDLATAKGMDLKTATDLLSKSVFSSTNAMSRYGIEIDGVVGSGERFNQAITSINDLMGGAAEKDAETFNGAMAQLGNTVGDLGEKFGEVLAPAILAVAGAIEAFAKFIDLEKIKAYGTAIGLAAGIWLAYSAAMKIATATTILFTKATQKNLVILAGTIAVGALLDISDWMSGSTDELADELAALEDDINNFNIGFKQQGRTKWEQFQRKTRFELILAQLKQVQDMHTAITREGLAFDRQAQALTDRATVIQNEINRIDEAIKDKVSLDLSESKVKDLKSEKNQLLIDQHNVMIDQAVRQLILQQKMNDAYLTGVKNAGDLAMALTKNAKAQRNIQFGLAMIDAYATFTRAKLEYLKLGIVEPFNSVLAGVEFAASVAKANNIRSQRFEQGGLVGGRRHSQGGTIIEAERGEFVMSRRAVESIGADNLSKMNQGGGAINVNVTGNVLSSDFVEGELADKISEAVRKGVDFGIS